MLISLGDFQFHLSTAAYDVLSRVTEAIWARQPILNSHEKLQAVGNANDVIQLVGTVYPQHAVMHGGQGSTESIDQLREYLKALTPLRITAVNGKTWGFWVIERLLHQDSRWISDGTPRKQEFRLQLRYYGQSYNGTTAQNRPRAFGNFNPGPRPVTSPRPLNQRSLGQLRPQAPTLTQPQVLDGQFKAEMVQDATAAVENTEIMEQEGQKIQEIADSIERTQQDTSPETVADLERSLDTLQASTTEIETNAAQAQQRVDQVRVRSQDISADPNPKARTIRNSIPTQSDTITEKSQDARENARALQTEIRIQKAQLKTTGRVSLSRGSIRAVLTTNREMHQETQHLQRLTVNLQAENETYTHETRSDRNLSQILNQQYGEVSAELLGQALDLNPGLASEPLRIPDGTEIELPVLEQPNTPTLEVETLW